MGAAEQITNVVDPHHLGRVLPFPNRTKYFYDNNGNLTSKQEKGITGEVINYSYSTENQLLGFKKYSSGQSSPYLEANYTYDALGRRIQKQVQYYNLADQAKSFTRRYVYDGQTILAEYDGNNNKLARYTHGPLAADDVLAVDVTLAGVTAGLAQDEGSYQYLKDGQGSIVSVADNSGHLIEQYIYSAFGVLLGIKDAQATDVTFSPPLATSYGFTGREFDRESGNMYYRARYYDPNTGRFFQKDPQPGKLSIPASAVNSYAYVANNPLNLTDPTGQSYFTDFIRPALFALVGAAAVLTGVGLAAGLGWSAMTGALAAVGSTALGAVVSSLALATGTSLATSTWGTAFWNSFGDAFRFNAIAGAAFLVVGAGIAIGSGGFKGAGGNWLQGYTMANRNLGGLTFGSTSFVGNPAPLSHELGHTMQFIGLSFLGGIITGDSNSSLAWGWGMYTLMGGIGLSEGLSHRQFFWETMLPKPF